MLWPYLAMAPVSSSKADRKAALDVGAWLFNVSTSVGIIMVNKQLMAVHGFSFGKLSLPEFIQLLSFVILRLSRVLHVLYGYTERSKPSPSFS